VKVFHCNVSFTTHRRLPSAVLPRICLVIEFVIHLWLVTALRSCLHHHSNFVWGAGCCGKLEPRYATKPATAASVIQQKDEIMYN
jgi:hypothetical protein